MSPIVDESRPIRQLICSLQLLFAIPDPNANPSHAGYETVFQNEVTFNGPFWKRVLLAVALAYGVSRVDYGITKGGEQEHPVGKLVERAQTKLSSEERIKHETQEELSIFLKRAQDVAAFRAIEEKPIHRLRNPDAIFKPQSRLGIPVGTQQGEGEETKVKTQYEDPDLYNPTGPIINNPPKNLVQIPWKI